MPAEMQGQNWASVAENALKQLVDIQSMIDIMSERLVALRDLRLQEYIKQDIRSLEGKLIKHFWKQLSTKCKVPKDQRTEAFQTYPSSSLWLTVVGVDKSVNEKLNAQGYSVESLLELSQETISRILHDNGGDDEDKRKLLAALGLLKAFQERNGNNLPDTEGIFWDSWCKSSNETHQNGGESVENNSPTSCVKSEMDYNENIHAVDCSSEKISDIAKNESRTNEHEILVHTASGRTNKPFWNEKGEITPTGMGHLSPPSPPHSSKSSLSSCGPPSPPPQSAKMYIMPHSNLHDGINTPPANTNVPSYTQHFAEENLDTKGRSGQSSVTSTPPLTRSNEMQDPNASNTVNKTFTAGTSHSLLLPFGPIKNARSYEWQVGNHITSVNDESMTNSNVSLSSITTLPPPSSSGPKLFAGKRKKRPGNIVIQANEKREHFLASDPPDLIDLLRSSNRTPSSSITISPESGLSSACTSTSPMSPRTPMTPATPFNNDMWRRDRDFSTSSAPPQTPKTPGKINRGLRAIRDKIKDKIGKRSHKLRRNKSEERVTDDVIAPVHNRHKARSETFPLINVSSIAAGHMAAGISSGTDHTAPRQSTEESRHNSTHSSSSSISESSRQLMRMHHDSSSFDAGFLSSGMTTPGEASLLSGRDKFGFDVSSYLESASNFTGTDQTLVAEDSEFNHDGSFENSYRRESQQEDEQNSELTDTLEEELESTMRSNLMRQTSTTSTMHEEWDIPWNDLDFQELIGQGRVGSVHKGKWHGEVAIRVIDTCHNDDFKLRAFKHEVMLYKKTRHDNIELFMGSCIHQNPPNPPKLAIVTGFCRGKSLYQYIRATKDQQVNLNQAKIIAQHIAQGMGYLHSRGIIHKDLKSKNIFVDGKRVVVTDFGLMGLHAISSKTLRLKPETLQIPDGWLCYMAPEVIRALKVPEEDIDVVSSLPYTKESDVYAFGTVWYELLTGCWPFKDYLAESIIWQVGNGKKQSLAHLQGPKELKDILMACWGFDHTQRPDFSDAGIMGHLLRLPQAKIIRRSSQPTRLSRGAPGGRDRLFDPLNFSSVLHELAE